MELNLTQTVMLGNYKYAGLFGQLGSESGTAAEVKNLKLTGRVGTQAAQLSATYCGALVGWNAYAKVSDVSSTATVYSSSVYTGGLVAKNDCGIIDNSWNNGAVTGNGSYTLTGGLVGELNKNAKLLNRWSNGTVTGGSYVGGLVGKMANSTSRVGNSYFAGTLNSGTKKGPLVGYLYAGKAYNAYGTAGSVTALAGAGGSSSNLTGCATKTAAEMQRADFADLLNTNRANADYVSTYTGGKLTAADLWYWHIPAGGGLPYLVPTA